MQGTNKIEHQLLLEFAKFIHNHSNTENLVYLLKSEIDWSYILKLAITQKLLPWVYKICEIPEIKIYIPENIFNRLKKQYLINFKNNSIRIKEFSHILIEFEKENIPIIPLKGLFLMEFVYPDFSTRSMCDFDILCQTKNVEKIFNMMNKKQWKTKKYAFRSIQFCHHPYTFEKNNLNIELHHMLTSLSEGYKINIDLLWKNAKHINSKPLNYFSLSHEDFLIHLKLHWFKHLIKGELYLKSFTDILNYEHVFKSEINIDNLNSKVIEYECLEEIDFINDFINQLSNYNLKHLNIDNKYIEHLIQNDTNQSIEFFHTKNFKKYTTNSKLKTIDSFDLKNQLIFERIFPDHFFLKSRYGNKPLVWLYLKNWMDCIKQYKNL